MSLDIATFRTVFEHYSDLKVLALCFATDAEVGQAAKLLTIVATENLVDLELEHWCGSHSPEEVMTWWKEHRMDNILCKAQFLKLGSLTLRFICAPSNADILRWSKPVKAALPRCFERDIVELEVENGKTSVPPDSKALPILNIL